MSYFYMGEPGPGQVARQLQHLRAFFESLPFAQMTPRDDLTSNAFCLARPPDFYAFYFPRGGSSEIDLSGARDGGRVTRWFDPREGGWRDAPRLKPGRQTVSTPAPADWALLVQGSGRR